MNKKLSPPYVLSLCLLGCGLVTSAANAAKKEQAK